ncbi:hypothetical protein [Streptomyces beijiangensis]|uniref:Regulatory protein n=1 Tax=Streptomyces beijiangensis TaxID=163361 RepID=A0A939FH26_9ACTN|nr:hypothetical protein [Streptomyces beijiangensis]MBO0517287.1 hypothetical protein [Streptomyces beijiangensis]
MSEKTQAIGVTAGYAQRVADDLGANQSEQERVRTELARLQDELVQLEQSEQILVKMQDVLGSAPKPIAKSGKGKKAARVPTARSAKGTTVPARPSRPVKAARHEERKAAKGPGEPTWGELITGHLAGQSEPKSAAEIASALSESHPDRRVQVTVVRNTLEQGVARGSVERSKQGRSVYYSLAATAAMPSETEAAAQ